MDYDGIIAFAPLAIYARNRDVANELPDMVSRAQKYVVARLDHDAFMGLLPDTTISAAGILDESGFPDDLLEVRSISWEFSSGRFMPLRQRAYEMLTMLYTDRRTGPPRYYAQAPAGGHHVFPAPGREVAAEVRGNVEPDILTPGNQTNLLSDRFPLLLQYATTREAAIFMQDSESIATYQGETDAALATANAQVARRTRDESGQRPVDTRNAQGS